MNVRVIIAVLITTAMFAATAQAQRPPAYVIPSVPAPRDPLPRFTIAPRGAPLGPVGLPLPPIGLQPPPNGGDPDRRFVDRGYFGWPAFVFYVSQPPAPSVSTPEPVDTSFQAPLPPGRVIFDVQPATAQVFADGYYIGTPEDFSAARGGGLLDPGAHRLDVSAPGYEPAAMDVRVMSGQSLTVRATLKALPPPAAIPATTFYLIPGCYMGNIPPKDAHLPPTCDQSRAVTWIP